MRADRLLSLLMMLQAHGKMTAQELADHLEVSERTVYRDIEALSIAGVPIYAERGPGGGCALLDGYRTTLTGLTEDEARALFMLTIPAALVDLGMSDELKQALHKLAASLPDVFRRSEMHVRQRIYLDWNEWFRRQQPIPNLHSLQRAVWEDIQVLLNVRLLFGGSAEWQVAPYGLVAKAGAWYLIYARNAAVRAIRLSDIIGVSLTQERYERPANFDLAAYWHDWCATYEQNRPKYQVTVRTHQPILPYLAHELGSSPHEIGQGASAPDVDGRITLTLSFETLEEARTRLLGLGRAVEVLEPAALRRSLIDFARQIVCLYGE